MTNNSKEAHYKALKAESIKVEKESKMADADDRMKRLKALISQAKHKAQTVFKLYARFTGAFKVRFNLLLGTRICWSGCDWNMFSTL